jgi:hypothetical protein
LLALQLSPPLIDQGKGSIVELALIFNRGGEISP